MKKCTVVMKDLSLEEIGEMQLSMRKATSRGEGNKTSSPESDATSFECALKGSKIFLRTHGFIEE